MDSLKSSTPTIPPTSHKENEAHRLTPEVLRRLYDALRKNRDGKPTGTSARKEGEEEREQGMVEDEDEDEPEVWEFGEEGFRRHATVFNGVVRSGASCLVRPRCARQVSR